MIPRECRRLAEVDFPIAAVSKHAVAEQSTRRGHPKGVHKWWARRPLASSRAVLLALLLPDPADDDCPHEFRAAVRKRLVDVPQPAPWHYFLRSGETENEGLRRVVLGFIADFAAWENGSKAAFLTAARALVAAAHGENRPRVVDPFAGGGAIPMEALRLGCDTFATDLNPVSCVILKTMLQDGPRRGSQMVETVRDVGRAAKPTLHKVLRSFYPMDPDGSEPLAYLWARTILCEAPRCGAEIPLLRTLWLSKKAKAPRILDPIIRRPGADLPRVDFRIISPYRDSDVGKGTVTRARACCLACGEVVPAERVRAQLVTQGGGADVVFDGDGRRIAGARMVAVVTITASDRSRHYRVPNAEDYRVVHRTAQNVITRLNDEEVKEKRGEGTPFRAFAHGTPAGGGSGAGRAFSLHRYGMYRWGDLFTARQKASMLAIADALGGSETAACLPIAKIASHSNVLAKWHSGSETVARAFGMQTLPMSWEFPEFVPLTRYAGGIEDSFSDVEEGLEHCVNSAAGSGEVMLADATDHPLPDSVADVWCTDPPYYDSVPYSDLADFFLIWLKRLNPHSAVLDDPFDPRNPLSPKTQEIVQDEVRTSAGRPKDGEWFEERMAMAFAEGRRILDENGVGSVVFAHQTMEGWEALLSGMIRSGWTITAAWPIATERGARLRARESAALATSVHLVCRPRPDDAVVGDWEDIQRELPTRVSDWMRHLQGEGIRGADLVFACIGPALEVFSRYESVEAVDGARITLRQYLERVWETVGRSALEGVLADGGGSGGELEEDARLTALFLWTMESSGDDGDSELDNGKGAGRAGRSGSGRWVLPFDVVRRFAQPMGIALDKWTGGIIEMEKGVVRLLSVAGRARRIFGESVADASDHWSEAEQVAEQPALDMEWHRRPESTGYRRNAPVLGPDARIRSAKATTLDRVHAAMLLQSGGRSQALRTLLTEETARGPEFLRLANALSALYPRGSEEKRLLDAMLLAVPR